MDVKRIGQELDRAEAVSDWQLTLQRRDETTVIRLPGIYTVRNGRLRVEPNPNPREVITTPAETAYLKVYAEHRSDGHAWRGDAVGQLESDEPASVRSVVDSLVAAARSQKNEPFPLPGSDEPYRAVPLADPKLAGLSSPALLEEIQRFFDGIVAGASGLEVLAVSNLELFVRRTAVMFRTSAGIALDYPTTRIDTEVCFLARLAEDRVGEHTARLSARRLDGLDPAAIVAEYGAAARAIAQAEPPPDWHGPVVLVGEAAADFLNGIATPISYHASSRIVYEKASRHKTGEPVGEGEPQGDPLNVTSDPTIPYGLRSWSESSGDGTAAQPVVICRDGRWDGLIGGRRYHHYLGLLDKGIAAPGPIANTVVPPGATALAELTSDRCLTVRAFSAWEVDDSSGDFSCEIRLGEVCRPGGSTPFKGGLLVGNWFRAIGDLRFSSETQVHGAYHGPRAIRVASLRVAG